MNKDNIEISAISYVDKDFGSIYPEILDIAKQLTNEWDPSNSNESDPGVVLLKEAAFVADHNNYNIDKNILENFLPSATQDISVRNICEMNGYTPRYYVSATGDISFNWTQPDSEKGLEDSFTIPAFTLVVSDANETVSYTQIENLVVNDNGPVSCTFIEGTKQILNINNSNIITLEDLDDNNRVYFPEVMVAQNGVYVKNYNSSDESDFIDTDDYWERDNYLLTRPSGTKVYKIDYDSIQGLPYIEFPLDISNIIGDGLIVEYISTSGKAGNINANTITKILSPATFYAIGETEARTTESFSVFNSGSISNGKDPETIDEMYKSFKKVVGTFDTLVSCNDYSNKVYTLVDGNDHSLVSNAFVTDRRTDYNKSLNVISYNLKTNNNGFQNISTKPCSLSFKGIVSSREEMTDITKGAIYAMGDELYVNITGTSDGWTQTKTINLNDFSILTEAMTPYELSIYALKVFSIGDYISINPGYALNKSFTPVDSITLETIKNDLELNKCICHTYSDPQSNDIFCFKNYVPLNIEIEPYSKIKPNEESKIIENICKALSEGFNPRNLEFGEKLDVDLLKKTIISADSRIKNVNINPLEYKIMAMNGNGVDLDISSTLPGASSNSTILVDLIAKNVLEGRICLFNFDNNFKFNFGQEGIKKENSDSFISVNKNVSELKSEALIKLIPSTDNNSILTMGENYDSITNTFKFNSESTNFRYLLKAPNLDGNIAPGLEYTLQTTGDEVDKFDIFVMENGRLKQIYEFKTDETTSYTVISPNTNTEPIINSSSDAQAEYNNGEIQIKKSTKNQGFELGSQNLNNYVLNANEVIQILNPNYKSDMTFSMYVNYKYINTDPNGVILANTEHKLQSSEKIILLYTTEGKSQQTILQPGTIVNANFNIYPTDQLSTNVVKKEWQDENKNWHEDNFRQLTSNQTISTRKLMQTRLDSSDIWCYWILNNYNEDEQKSVLFKSGEYEIILGNNEYFIYTNSALNEMIILGGGTKLERSKGSSDDWWVLNSPNISIDTISQSGTSIGDTNINWKKLIDFPSYPLYITEMAVTTLGEGDTISIYGWDDMPKKDRDDSLKSEYYIGPEWEYCNATIDYKINGTTDFVQLIKTNDFYQIRSRLDINMSNEYPQTLYKAISDDGYSCNSVQRIILNYLKSDKVILEAQETEESSGLLKINEVYVQSSTPLGKIGSDKGVIDLSDYEPKVNFYHYTREKDLNGNIVNYVKSFILGQRQGERSYKFFFDSSCGEFLIPIHISGSEVPIKVYIVNSNKEKIMIGDYNQDTTGTELTLFGDSSYYINPKFNGTDNLTLTVEWDTGTQYENESVIIGDITVISDVNTELKPATINGQSTMQLVLNRMKEIISGSDKPTSVKYNYAYKPDNSIIMDNLDFEDANSMWDINNIANKITIPQIDLNNSIIKVISSMKRS